MRERAKVAPSKQFSGEQFVKGIAKGEKRRAVGRSLRRGDVRESEVETET